MLLKEGDNIFVAHRRLFDKDEPRFFVGRVDAYEAGVIKTTGHSYVRDLMDGRMIEKPEERTKILSLSSGTLLVYQLPRAVALDALKFVAGDGSLSLTDGKAFTMNLMEHTHGGQV
ncbi:MAG TPA: hypothetical protein PK402_01750 [Tepidisphaeraceae bacterium]|nr:hypothetical protein [Tepidisphaeraceae bacterium]